MKIGNISADFGVPILGHKGASRHVREVVAAFGHDGHSVFALSPAVAEGRRFTELHSLLKGSGLATRSEVERTIVFEILTRRAARATSSPPARGTTPSRSTPAGATTASCSQSTPKERRIDDVSDTDGIAVTNRPTSGQFPRGVFVAQDGKNAGGNQNFKLYAWEDIAGTRLIVDTSWSPRAK
jgi:phytase-like protein